MSPQPGSNANTGKFGNTYGLSQQFLESLGIDGNLIPKVFVSNLDFRVDDKKLKEIFRLAGRVLVAEVNKDKEGKSRGHATVEFEHPVEAVQAISMFNNQQLFERRMHVKMDRLSDPIADLAKNRLPDGLRTIGMGLGVNGQPLVDVARNLPSSNNSSSGNAALISGVGAALTNAANLAANPLAVNAMNLGNLGMNQLTSVLNSQGIDLGIPNAQSLAAQAAAANIFNAAGMGQVSGLNPGQNQFSGGQGGLQMNALGGVGNPGGVGLNSNAVNALMGNTNPGSGGVNTGNPQQSPFQKYEKSLRSLFDSNSVTHGQSKTDSELVKRDRISVDSLERNYDNFLKQTNKSLNDVNVNSFLSSYRDLC
jgi:RNA recognition motif-containing protein